MLELARKSNALVFDFFGVCFAWQNEADTE